MPTFIFNEMPETHRMAKPPAQPVRMSSSLVVDADFGELYVPPTTSLGRVPNLKPVQSGGKAIEGDFPLDQIVIDR